MSDKITLTLQTDAAEAYFAQCLALGVMMAKEVGITREDFIADMLACWDGWAVQKAQKDEPL